MLDPRFRTALLEDREPVIQLRGFKKSNPILSNQPHAGMWGPDTAYVLIPCRYPARRAAAILRFDPTLVDRSSDAEVLILGSKDAIRTLLRSGPEFCRARILPIRPKGIPDHLKPHMFTTRTENDPPAHSSEDLGESVPEDL